MSVGLFARLVMWTSVTSMSMPVLAQSIDRSACAAGSRQLNVASCVDEEGTVHVLLRATAAAANASGNAQISARDGRLHISIGVRDLPAPASLGPYSIYIVWAVTPGGQIFNRGEIGEQGRRSLLSETHYDASELGLLVTAEPHFAVALPSTMTVLGGIAGNPASGAAQPTLPVERLDYARLGDARLSRLTVDPATNPVAIIQARYAIAIARGAGADQLAAATYTAARLQLEAAETALLGRRRSERLAAPSLARTAVVTAETAYRAALLGAASSTRDIERLQTENSAVERANDGPLSDAIAADVAINLARATDTVKSGNSRGNVVLLPPPLEGAPGPSAGSASQ